MKEKKELIRFEVYHYISGGDVARISRKVFAGETPAFYVTVGGRRIAKKSDRTFFFESFEAARAFAIGLANEHAESGRRRQENGERAAALFAAAKEPPPGEWDHLA